MSDLGLVRYNKRFLYCGVGAPRSLHDSRMLRSTLYEETILGNIPDKGITLGDFRNMPLVTIGDSETLRFRNTRGC